MNFETKLRGLSHLIKTYFTILPTIIYRSTLSLLCDPKGAQNFIHQILNDKDLALEDPFLGSLDLKDIMNISTISTSSNREVDVQIIGPYYNRISGDTRQLLELANIAFLIKTIKPDIVFEIGTFIGMTTRLMAINSLPNCKIITLDLPQEQVTHSIGSAFKGSPEGEKIRQLLVDSQEFDFSPWYGQCDFVWVDACHDFNEVTKDTNNALMLCRVGGWVGWHDYRHTAWWSGVTQCVRKLSRKYPGLKHIKGTTIAILQKQ